jgi:hypothetical protein
MATTTLPDISAIIPEAIRAETIDAYVANATLAPLAEQDNTLQGVGVGDRLTIGSFGAVTAALNLAETEAIVPKKLTATARSFIAGRIGDAYSYSYMSGRFSPTSLQTKAGQYLGKAAALRVDINLAATALSTVLAPRKITIVGVLTAAKFIEGVRQFPDELRSQLVAVLTAGQRAALTDAVLAGGTQYQGQTVWRDGEIDRFFGVSITTNSYLATTTGSNKAALLFLRGRTLVSAFAQDPLIEVERFPKTATIDVTMNGIWAGGVQELDTLTVIDALG